MQILHNYLQYKEHLNPFAGIPFFKKSPGNILKLAGITYKFKDQMLAS